MNIRRYFLCFLVLMGLAPFSFGADQDKDLPHFQSLTPWLARGQQPTAEGLKKLKEQGYRTIINFRQEPDWNSWEKARVAELGLNYVSIPWTIFHSPDDSVYENFFAAVDQPQNRPVFFHCKHGRDRSGVLAVLSLIRYREMSRAEAETIVFGFRKPTWLYRRFVNQRIGQYLQNQETSKNHGHS